MKCYYCEIDTDKYVKYQKDNVCLDCLELYYDLSTEQIKAIKSLESAFKKASKVGLVFFGMDMDLIAFDKGVLTQLEKLYNTRDHRAMNKLGQGTDINTHETYKDSGGW